MNFQEKVLETTAICGPALPPSQRDSTLRRARRASQRLICRPQVAGRELNKVARRHASRFVNENSSIARDAGKDVSALARATYASWQARRGPTQKARKPPAARKRAAAQSGLMSPRRGPKSSDTSAPRSRGALFRFCFCF